MASCLLCRVRPVALFTSLIPWHPSSTSHSLTGSVPPYMISSIQMTQKSSGSSSPLQRITTQVQNINTHTDSSRHMSTSVVHTWLTWFTLFTGRMLDLKTGTVKKESQQSSARMGMGARRSFICRMRYDSYCTQSSSLLVILKYVPGCINCSSDGLFVCTGVAHVPWNRCRWTD